MSLKSYAAICAECETHLPVDSRYCPNCKTPTSDGILRCAVCRTPIKPGDSNCKHCNAILTPLAVPASEENEISEEQNYISGDRDAFADVVRSSVELPVLSEDMIGGKYKIVKRIGRGGFGTVYEVDKILRGSLLKQALKIAVANEQCDLDAVARIIHEFNIGGQVDVITNVVKPESPDSCTFKGRELVMLPMPLADSGNLRQWLGGNRDSENYKENATELFRQVCSGVREIHKAGILHLDIKPENILLFSRSEAEEIDSNIAKIADFGIAKHYKDKFRENPKELLKQGIGTPEYMSPEQFLVAHQEDIEETSDIYSLGIVLFEILAGRRPFDGDFDSLQSKHVKLVPPLLEGKLSPYWEITKRCIEKKPKARYQDMDQLLKDLSRAEVGFHLSSEVACPECGHINENVEITNCEICSHVLPAKYFRHECMQCFFNVRVDQEKCPRCKRGDVGAHYRLEDRKKLVARLKDEDIEESIRLLEIILRDGAEDYTEDARSLIAELRQKQPEVKALIKETSEQKLAGEIEDAINTLRKVLTLVHRHRIAMAEKEYLELLLRNLRKKTQDALMAMDEARFTEAENLLLECLKDAPNHKDTKETFETCLERAQNYTCAFKDAQRLAKEALFSGAKDKVNIAISQAPESLEAKSLSEQIDKAWAKSLLDQAHSKIRAAKFEEAEGYLKQAEHIYPAAEGLNEVKELLSKVQSVYSKHMGEAQETKQRRDFKMALKAVNSALKVCPDSENAKKLKNDIAKLKKDKEKWRAEFRKDVIAAAKWLFVLIPGIAGIVMLVLYTKLEIGGIAIGIGILAGIFNCIRKTGIYNTLSNWDFIKGEARPAFFLISLLLVVSSALSLTNKPLTALIFPVLAVVYSFGKELKVLIAITAKSSVINDSRTQIGKVATWWKHLSSKSKTIGVITTLLLIVGVSAAVFVGTYQSKQRSEILADTSNAAASQVVGNWKRAVVLYEKLLARKPDNTSFQNSLAVCQHMVEAETAEREGNLDEALIHCQTARDLATVPAIVGVIETKIKDISDEKERFDKITALLTEAQALKNKGELNISLNCITEVLTLDTDNAKAKQFHIELTTLIEQERFRKLMAEAVNHETQGDWEKAIEAYSQVMIIKPDNSDVKGKLDECYHNLNLSKAKEAENNGELNKVIGYYTKALSYKQVPSTQVALESAREKQAKPDQLLSYLRTDDSDAMYHRGQMHENADGVRRNYQKAIECYRKAAEAGHIGAMNRLGAMYYAGMGVPRNFNKAVEWYHKAIDMGDSIAMNNLGAIYMVNEYYEKAIKWYHRAIEAENSTAMHHLGMMYHEGCGVSKDYKKAVEWYRKAAEAGNSTGMNSLGVMYKNGWGIAQNYQKAEEWFHKSVEKGNSDAMHNLGQMYRKGNGLRRDYQKAIEWFHKAAEAGDSDGMCSLGTMYYGGIGVVKDYKKAMEWYRKAAETGDSVAMHNLGVMYKSGNGVSINYQKAMEYFRKAAEAGNNDAMNNLGAMYYDGRGVVKDHKKAMEWFRKAARLGNEGAQQNLINFGETW